MKHRVVIMVLFTAALCGCNPNDSLRNMMDRMAPDDDEALAKECLAALRAGDFHTVKKRLDPQFVKPGIESNLTQVAAMLDHGKPLSLELVGYNVFSTSEKKRSHLTYQYQFTNAWVLAAITIDTVDGSKKVFGVNVNPIPKSLGELNAFTLSGKGIQHYLMLLLTLAVPLFILVVLVLCVRTKVKKRKWLWIIFILFGFGKLGLNWTTGQILFNPLSFNFQLFGAAAVKQGLYAPWILSVSLPLGAISFLIRRKKLSMALPPPIGTEDTEPEVGQVSSEAAPSAPPDEPST